MITYLPLPKINCPEFSVVAENIYTSTNPGYEAKVVTDKNVLVEVKKAFISVSDKRTMVWFQRIDSRFNGYIHKDPREYTISYILKCGGPNVETQMHDEEGHILQSIVLESNRWHLIKTSEFHSVNNIEGNRESLSVSVGKSINAHLLPWSNSLWNDNNDPNP